MTKKGPFSKPSKSRPTVPEEVAADAPPIPPEFRSPDDHGTGVVNRVVDGVIELGVPGERAFAKKTTSKTTTADESRCAGSPSAGAARTDPTTTILQEKKVARRKRNSREVVRPGAQAVHEPAVAMDAHSHSRGPELVEPHEEEGDPLGGGRTSTSSGPLPPEYRDGPADAVTSTGDSYLARLARKRRKNKLSGAAVRGRPASEFVVTAEVEPLDVPRPTEIEGGRGGRPPAVVGGVLEQRAVGGDGLGLGGGDGDGRQSHGRGRHGSRRHRYGHGHGHGDVENRGSFSDSHDDDDDDDDDDYQQYQQRQLQQQLHFRQQNRLSYQETSIRNTNPKQWSKYQMRFALCSVLNFILIIVIIAMGVIIAKNDQNNSNSNNNLKEENTNTANNLDTIDSNANNTKAFSPSFAPMPSCLQASFRQQLLPRSVVCPDYDNNNASSSSSSSCPEIFVAVDGNHSVVTVGNTLYFFQYTDKAVVQADASTNTNSTNNDANDNDNNDNNVIDGIYFWKITQTTQLHSSNQYLPVAISKDTVVVGAPTETKDSSNGVAYIYQWNGDDATIADAAENAAPSWRVVDQLEHGWTNEDIELDAGVVSLFGKTVDVRDDLIVIGAYADIGTIHPTFFFRRDRFGWDREEMSNRSNDRLRSVANVAIGPDGLALSTLRDPPFGVSNDGTVFLFQSQDVNRENANNNSNNDGNNAGSTTQMGLFQKLTWETCNLFGDVAQFLDDGSLLASCWKIIDAGDGGEDGAATSKVSILYFTRISGNYEFQQEFVLENGVAVSDLDSKWFTVDRERGTLLVREDVGVIRVYGRMGRAEDPWQIYPEATFVRNGDGAAYGDNDNDNDVVSGGEMAVSGNTVFMRMDDDLQVFQLEDC